MRSKLLRNQMQPRHEMDEGYQNAVEEEVVGKPEDPVAETHHADSWLDRAGIGGPAADGVGGGTPSGEAQEDRILNG